MNFTHQSSARKTAAKRFGDVRSFIFALCFFFNKLANFSHFFKKRAAEYDILAQRGSMCVLVCVSEGGGGVYMRQMFMESIFKTLSQHRLHCINKVAFLEHKQLFQLVFSQV